MQDRSDWQERHAYLDDAGMKTEDVIQDFVRDDYKTLRVYRNDGMILK